MVHIQQWIRRFILYLIHLSTIDWRSLTSDAFFNSNQQNLGFWNNVNRFWTFSPLLSCKSVGVMICTKLKPMRRQKYQSQLVLITCFWTDYKIKIPKVKSMYHFDNPINDCFPWRHIAIASSEKFHGSWITPTNAKERSRGASLLMVMDGALLCSLMEQCNGLLSDWEIHLCAILPSWFFGKDSRFCFPKSRAHLPLLLGVFN